MRKLCLQNTHKKIHSSKGSWSRYNRQISYKRIFTNHFPIFSIFFCFLGNINDSTIRISVFTCSNGFPSRWLWHEFQGSFKPFLVYSKDAYISLGIILIQQNLLNIKWRKIFHLTFLQTVFSWLNALFIQFEVFQRFFPEKKLLSF